MSNEPKNTRRAWRHRALAQLALAGGVLLTVFATDIGHSLARAVARWLGLP